MTHTNDAADSVTSTPHTTAKRPAGAWTGLLLGLIVTIAVGALIVQNTDKVRVQWLTLDRQLPLWAMLAATAVAGALLAKLLGLAWRHRSRHS